MVSMRELSEKILGQTILNKETKDYVMTPSGPVRRPQESLPNDQVLSGESIAAPTDSYIDDARYKIAQKLYESGRYDDFRSAYQATAGLDKIRGRAEAVATVGTGLASLVPAGLAGLGTFAMTQDPEAAAETVKDVQRYVTYAPRSAQGRENVESFAKAISPLGMPAKFLGNKALEITGSPAYATGVEIFGDPLNLLGLKGIPAIGPLAEIATKAGKKVPETGIADTASAVDFKLTSNKGIQAQELNTKVDSDVKVGPSESTGIIKTESPVDFEIPSTPSVQVQQERILGAQLPGSSAPVRFDETIREQEVQKVKNISEVRGNKKPKIEDLVDYFEADHLARYGRQLDPYDEADFRTAIGAAADEVNYQLKQSETGAGWYDSDIKTTFELMAEIPALKSMRNNETDRVIWTALAAPTSIGNNVDLNTKAATAAMLQYKKTGKIPTSPPNAGAVTEGLKGAGWGAKQQAVAAGMKVIDRLITDLGEQGFADWWLSPHTLGELTAVRKAAGLSGAPSGLSGGKNSMHLGAMILGDKTGKYSLNLNGYEGPTKDVWFSRSYNRHFGNMKDNKGLPMGGPRSSTERRRMEEFTTAMKAKLEDTGLSEQDIQAVLWFYEQNLFTDLGVVSRPGSFSKGMEKVNEQLGVRPAVRRSDGIETTAEPGATLSGFREISPSQRAVRAQRRLEARDAMGSQRDGNGGGRYSSGSLAPLEGAPVISGATGPDPTLVSVAEKYADAAGIPFSRQPEYYEVNRERSERIAQAYEDMPHDPNNPKVKAAYEDLIRQTENQYQFLADNGYEFSFFDSNSDPYDGNPYNAMRDLRQNKRMAVYGTYDGYGTKGITGAAIADNPMLKDTGLRWRDQDGVEQVVTANDLFRAVHDTFGHGLEGAGFRARGEENAWQAHARLFTGDALKALTTETRGQNSWLNYGPFGDTNRKAKLEGTVFAEQKTGLMPDWTSQEGR